MCNHWNGIESVAERVNQYNYLDYWKVDKCGKCIYSTKKKENDNVTISLVINRMSIELL